MRFFKRTIRMSIIFTLLLTCLLSLNKTYATTSRSKNSINYEFDNYTVKVSITNDWEYGYTGEIKIRNNDTKPIEGWELSFDFDHNIDYMWSANISHQVNNNYIIKPMSYNEKIAPGETVTCGFLGAPGNIKELPSNFELTEPELVEISQSQYNAEGRVLNDWIFGYQGQISIENLSEDTIKDWVLEFEYDDNIDMFYNAKLVKRSGNKYIIKNLGYNANIPKDKKIIIRFAGVPGKASENVNNFKLYTNSFDKKENNPTKINDFNSTNVRMNSANLSWNVTNTEQVDYYILYRDGEEILKQSGTSYNDLELKSNKTYEYQLKVIGNDGIELDSDKLTVTTKEDTEAPSMPGDLEAKEVNMYDATIDWNASTDNEKIECYIIYRDGKEIDITTETQYKDAGLELGTTYTYEVKAMDIYENKSEANTIEVTTKEDTEAPSMPGDLEAKEVNMY
ncbi:MAG: cellulose binding domain-containing protein, partial [bacterium]